MNQTEEQAGVRRRFLDTMRKLLLGPFTESERLETVSAEIDPSDFYLTGILWPRDTGHTAEEDESSSVEGTVTEEGDGDGQDHGAPLFSMFKPSSIGLTCSVPDPTAAITVRVRAARYRMEPSPNGQVQWERVPIECEFPITPAESRTVWTVPFREHALAIHIRMRQYSAERVVTATLMNMAPRPEQSRPGPACLFQTSVAIHAVAPDGSPKIAARQRDAAVPDEETRSGDLLFRDRREYAAGHSISAGWSDPVGDMVGEVRTEWIPERIVHGVTREGNIALKPLRDRAGNVFSAGTLAEATRRHETVASLEEFHAVYATWIEAEADRMRSTLPDGEYRKTAELNLKQCCEAAKRMLGGIQLLATDATAWRAFQLANAAMEDYFRSPQRGNASVF